MTARLKDGAKLLYMAVMFMGRVGPVSLAMSLTAKPDDNKRKIMPVGHINVGRGILQIMQKWRLSESGQPPFLLY